MNYLVRFISLIDDEEDINYGILLEDKTVLCLDCLGIFEENDYTIIEKYDELPLNISDILKMELEE